MPTPPALSGVVWFLSRSRHLSKALADEVAKKLARTCTLRRVRVHGDRGYEDDLYLRLNGKAASNTDDVLVKTTRHETNGYIVVSVSVL